MMTIPISDALAQAFGWTLVHSLWQATLIALLLLLLLPRLQSAQKRYWAAYGSLLGVLLIAVVTFGWVYQKRGVAARSTPEATDSNTLVINDYTSGIIAETNLLTAVPGWLEAHYPLMVTLWLLGFGLFLFRLAGGLWYVNRLRHEGLFHVEPHWQERINQLGERLSQSRPVALFQSALVHTPVAIGYLKPIVLLPIGFINRLSPAEVEAVLTHELAHIARRDWLFNLLQAFIESLFYFHPAVWWMSGIVRSERENCCDDAAIALSGNPLYYAKALLRVQELAKAAPVTGLALGLDGSITSTARRRMFLLERVCRILNQPQHKSHNMEKFVATAVLLVLLLLVGLRANTPPVLEAAFAQISEFTPDFLKSQTDDYSIQGDSLKPRGKRKIVQEDDNRRIEVEYQDDQVTRLNIDGKEIPATEFSQHRDLTETMLLESVPPMPPAAPYPPAAPMPPGGWAPPMPPGGAGWAPPMPPTPPTPPRISTTKGNDGSILLRIENDDQPVEIRIKDGETWVDGRKLAEGEELDLPGLSKGTGNGFGYGFSWGGADGNVFHFSPDRDFHFEGLEGLEGLEHVELSADDRKRMEEDMYQAREEQLRALEESHRELGRHHKEMEKDLKLQRKEIERSQKESAEQYHIAMLNHQRAMEESRVAQARAMQEQRRSNQNITFWGTQLKQDGIVIGSKDYSMQLTDKKLIVNGKKQSDEIHRKYLELYTQRGGQALGKDGSFMINWNSDEE